MAHLDDVGLLPFANRYLFFSPVSLDCEREWGGLDGVPRIAVEGWQRLAVVGPDMHACLMAPALRVGVAVRWQTTASPQRAQ